MPTVFPFKATWGPAIGLDLSIPGSVTTSRLQKEQRGTTYGEGEFSKEFVLSYPSTDETAARRLRHLVAEGLADDGLFWVPFAMEPVDVGVDWSSPGINTSWSGSDHALIKGPDWWQGHRILRPREEFVDYADVPNGTFSDMERVIRINLYDPTDYEVKTLTQWSYNYGGYGILGYTVDSAWTGTSPAGNLLPHHAHQYFHMDLCSLASLQERPLTDTQIMHDITWRSAR